MLLGSQLTVSGKRISTFSLSVPLSGTAPDRVVTLHLRQPLLPIVFAFIFIWHLAAPSEVTAISLAALGGLLVGAFLWARAMALRVTGQRQLRSAAMQVGDELEELITLANVSALPVLWAEFVDQSDFPGYTVASVRAADGQSTIRWRAHTLCTHHGLHVLGPWELRLGDPFGIFLVRQIYTQPQEVLIYPPLAVLPDELLPHSASVGDHRPLRQPLWAETITASHTRAYQPGDPVRHLHWRTTARREALYTKVFEPEASSTVWIIPDLDAKAHLTPYPRPLPPLLIGEGGGVTQSAGEGGEAGEDTEETTMLLAASLANQLLRKRLSVGLAAFTDKAIVVPPQPGTPHLWKILRALAPLRPTGAWPFAQTISNLQSLVSPRDLVMVITPSVNADWPIELHRLIRRGGGAEAILLDPLSFGGEGDAEACAWLLAELNITPKIIRRGDLHPVSGAYGPLRRWEFMALGTGRVLVKQRPRGV